MKRHWVEYSETWNRDCPMTWWVHRPSDGKPVRDAESFDPPAPRPVPGKGYPTYFVEFDGFTFCFSSLDELDVCIETLGQRHLPEVRPPGPAAKLRPGPSRHAHELMGHPIGSGEPKYCTGRRAGAPTNWLEKLPGSVLKWRYRQRVVRYLQECREEFARLYGAKDAPPDAVD